MQGADYSLADLVGGAPLTPDAIVRSATFRYEILNNTTLDFHTHITHIIVGNEYVSKRASAYLRFECPLEM